MKSRFQPLGDTLFSHRTFPVHMISESDLEGKNLADPTSTVADGAVRGVFVVFEGIDGSGKSTISTRSSIGWTWSFLAGWC